MSPGQKDQLLTVYGRFERMGHLTIPGKAETTRQNRLNDLRAQLEALLPTLSVSEEYDQTLADFLVEVHRLQSTDVFYELYAQRTQKQATRKRSWKR